MSHLGLARKLARRYAGRGQPLDDLTQVAMIGLMAAADRFDPARGTSFAGFAVPTILGEIRRYFRDRCWMVRIPRRLHDQHDAIITVRWRLAGQLGRGATVGEIAAELNLTCEEVLRAVEAGSAYSALSLEAPDSNRLDTANPANLADRLGALDGNLELIEMRETVRKILPTIPLRESRILVGVFYQNRSQSDIARELGISQMHVSRLLAKTLAVLRTAIHDDRREPIRWPRPRHAIQS